MNGATVAVPLPPNPPPPPCSVNVDSKETLVTQHLIRNQVNLSAEEEVSKACRKILGRLPEDCAILSTYNPTKAVIQNGPTCGLVALQMAAQALRLPTPAIDDVLQLAKSRGFTIQGEMFSAAQLGQVAEELLRCTVRLLSDGLRSDGIFEHLARGRPMLVPYDADFNHEPCCKKGHKAHWATVTGFLEVLNPASANLVPTNDLERDQHLENLYHVRGERGVDLANDVYFLAKQGKSNNLGVWSFGALEASNANLVEIDPRRADDGSPYVFPRGGIVEGLRRRVVLLSV